MKLFTNLLKTRLLKLVKLASEDNKSYRKGHIHTDILMKEVLKRQYKLINKPRLSHVWHMTLEKDDKPIIITDGALNAFQMLKLKCIY